MPRQKETATAAGADQLITERKPDTYISTLQPPCEIHSYHLMEEPKVPK